MNKEEVTVEAEQSRLLVNKILSGDQAAERAMIQRYQSKLFNTIFARANDIDLTNDIVQETWAITLDKVRNAKLINKASLGSFIYKVGIYQLTMYYRKRKNFCYVDGADVQEFGYGDLFSSYCKDQDRIMETIMKPLGRMSISRDKELINSFYLQGTSKADLCEKFHLTTEHFDRVLHRARERFKKEWDKANYFF